jgi:hypothetical protein
VGDETIFGTGDSAQLLKICPDSNSTTLKNKIDKKLRTPHHKSENKPLPSEPQRKRFDSGSSPGVTFHGTGKFPSVHPDTNKSKNMNSHSVKFSNPNRVSFLETKQVQGQTIQGIPFSNVNTLDNLGSVQGNNDSQEIAMPRFQIQI